MSKGFASLHVGLISRHEPPRITPPPAPVITDEELDGIIDEAPENIAAPLYRPAGTLAPSASLTADLITQGREAYRAERQRLAERMEISSPGALLVPPAGPAPAPEPSPPVRDVAGGQGHGFGDFEARPALEAPVPAAPHPVVPSPVAPAAALTSAPVSPPKRRRRAVTLRLRPDQHARLLAVRRQLGCSFQVLVVRALNDFFDNLDQPVAPPIGTRPEAGRLTREERPGALSSNVVAAKMPADVHIFTLASGWCLAAWQQERGAKAATPSEVLAMVLRDQGLGDLISAPGTNGGIEHVDSVSLGDRGHRLALTIRLDSKMHDRLLGARRKLGRTGQDILMSSIDAYLTD